MSKLTNQAFERQAFEETICKLALATELALSRLDKEARTRVEAMNPKMAQRHNKIILEVYSMARN